jgi:ribosomal protein S19E (S16A)
MAETTPKKEVNPNFVEARKHMKAARTAMRKSVETLLPAGYVENHRTARREVLLALRSMLDVAIEKTDKK